MFALENDGIRNIGEFYRKQVDDEIKKYLHLNSNTYTISSNDLSNRINEVLHVLKDRGFIDSIPQIKSLTT